MNNIIEKLKQLFCKHDYVTETFPPDSFLIYERKCTKCGKVTEKM